MTQPQLVFFVGEPDDGALDRFADDYATTNPDLGGVGREELGQLLAWICSDAHAVYMGPKWRSSVVARAIRTTAVAAGIEVYGFE